MTIGGLIDKISGTGAFSSMIEIYDTRYGDMVYFYDSKVDNDPIDDNVFHRRVEDFSINTDFVNKLVCIKIDF